MSRRRPVTLWGGNECEEATCARLPANALPKRPRKKCAWKVRSGTFFRSDHFTSEGKLESRKPPGLEKKGSGVKAPAHHREVQ